MIETRGFHGWNHSFWWFNYGGWDMQKTMVFCGRSSIVGFDLGLWNTNGWGLISHPKTSQNIPKHPGSLVWRDGRMKIFFNRTNPCRDGGWDMQTPKKWNRLTWRCYYLPLKRLNLWYTMIFVELRIELYDKWSKISIISIIMTMITLLNYVLLNNDRFIIHEIPTTSAHVLGSDLAVGFEDCLNELEKDPCRSWAILTNPCVWKIILQGKSSE